MHGHKEILLLILGLLAACPHALAAGSDLSRCLDANTVLEAGGAVPEKELMAARQACLRAQQSSLGSLDRTKVEAALATIGEEQQRHSASH
jgi:hypothetical protein